MIHFQNSLCSDLITLSTAPEITLGKRVKKQPFYLNEYTRKENREDKNGKRQPKLSLNGWKLRRK